MVTHHIAPDAIATERVLTAGQDFMLTLKPAEADFMMLFEAPVPLLDGKTAWNFFTAFNEFQ